MVRIVDSAVMFWGLWGWSDRPASMFAACTCESEGGFAQMRAMGFA